MGHPILVTGEDTVEDKQHYDNSNPKQNLKRDVFLLDDFFVETAARWGVKVFGVFQGVAPEVLRVGCSLERR